MFPICVRAVPVKRERYPVSTSKHRVLAVWPSRGVMLADQHGAPFASSLPTVSMLWYAFDQFMTWSGPGPNIPRPPPDFGPSLGPIMTERSHDVVPSLPD